MNAKFELDYQLTDDWNDWMLFRVDEEAQRLDRALTWDEAVAFLKGKLADRLQTDGEEVLGEWLSTATVPVASWTIEGASAVAWGNYPTEEAALEGLEHTRKLHRQAYPDAKPVFRENENGS